MKQLIININPFIVNQTFFIFEGSQMTKTGSFQLKDINKTVFANKDIDKVILCGNKTYVQKFVNSLKEEELHRYNKNTITYEIKERSNV